MPWLQFPLPLVMEDGGQEQGQSQNSDWLSGELHQCNLPEERTESQKLEYGSVERLCRPAGKFPC